jgi:hypothetical protein
MIIQEGKEDIQAKRHKVLHQKQKINDVLGSHLLAELCAVLLGYLLFLLVLSSDMF